MRYYYKTTDGKGYLCLKSPLANTNGYVEISEQDFNEHQESLKHEPTAEELQKLADKQELNEILKWFERYDMLCLQYARHQRLGIESDIDIESLDEQATTKANRVKELRDSN